MRVVRSGLVSEIRVTPRQDLLLCGITEPRRGGSSVLREHHVALAGRREPRCAGWRSPARRCRRAGRRSARPSACLPAVDRRAREAARRHRQRGPGDPAQHDGVPERLRPAVHRPRSASSGGRRRPTTSTSAGQPAVTVSAERVRADVPLDELTAHLRPLLERFADDGSLGAGLRRLVPRSGWSPRSRRWLPAPTVRRRERAGAEAAESTRRMTGVARRGRPRRPRPADRPRRPLAGRG